jgi:2-haloalkanoic acid dehalogenase type II
MKSFPQAILLDFYGTVVEEDDAYIGRICREVAAASPLHPSVSEVGAHWSCLFGQMCNDSFDAAFRTQEEIERRSLGRVLQHFQAGVDGKALSHILIAYWAAPTLFPESVSVLSQCRVPVCLVSNIDNRELDLALEHTGLSFDWVVTSEDCRAYKPRSAMFKRALSLLNVHPEDVLHVGDSLGSDVRGAKTLGMPVLWINRRERSTPSANAPDYSAPDLTGLSDFLIERDNTPAR